MTDYQPTQEDVQQGIQLLMTATTATGLGAIENMKHTPQFFEVLSHILAKESDPQLASARQLAGEMIKNNIQYPACAGHPVVQENVLATLGDPLEAIRRTGATAISTAIQHSQWRVEAVESPLLELKKRSSLDLLSTLSTAVEEQVVDVVNQQGVVNQQDVVNQQGVVNQQDANTFAECMRHCLSDESAGVRAAAGLLGDLASAAPRIVQDLLPQLENTFLDGLRDPANRTSEANNLAWLLHELLRNQVEGVEGVACLTSRHLDRYLI